MNVLKKSHLALGIVLSVVLGTMANVNPGESPSASEAMAGTQDVRTLDRRISMLEQRLYSIESSISRLQRDTLSQRRPDLQPGIQDLEIKLMREAIQKLQLQLLEIECGLVKLDERTIMSVRDTRPSERPKPVDPCRLNPATPLRLSSRP